MGDYSGYLGHVHDYNRTYGGVSHYEYDQEVRNNLIAFMKDRKITKKNPMTEDQMKEFLGLIKSGKNFDGSINQTMLKYNRSIKGFRTSWLRKIKQAVDPLSGCNKSQLGRDYMSTENFNQRARASKFLSAVSLILVSRLPDPIGFLTEASESLDFRRGLQALNQGDLLTAEKYFFGDGGAKSGVDNFFSALASKTNLATAESFRQAYLAASQNASQSAEDFKKPPAGPTFWDGFWDGVLFGGVSYSLRR